MTTAVVNRATQTVLVPGWKNRSKLSRYQRSGPALEEGNALFAAAVRDGIPLAGRPLTEVGRGRKVNRKRVERADWTEFLATAEENYASLLDQ